MPLSAEFTVNGNPNPLEHIAAYGDTVALALVSLVGADIISCSIVGTAFQADAVPVVTLTGTPVGATAVFTIPADPGDDFGRSYRIKYRVATASGLEADEQYGIVGVLNSNGILPLAAGEFLERSRTHGWTEVINRALIQTGGGGATSLGGDVIGNVGATTVIKIHGASVPVAGATGTVLLVTGSNALGYQKIADANVDANAAIAGTKISPNFGSQTVQTTGPGSFGSMTVTGLGLGLVHSSSGGAFTSSLLANADVASNAAIAVAKLANGTNGQILATVTTTPTWVTAGGDVTGAPTAFSVVKVRGATVGTAAGALVTGQAIRATGVSTIDYGPIDLSNPNAVTGTLPTGNLPQSAFQFQNVADIATMQALVVTSFSDGTHCWVRTKDRAYILKTTAQTADADLDTYASATSGRLWMGAN